MRNGKKSSWNSAFGQGITFRFAKMKTKNSGGEVSDKEWKARDSLLILSITTAVVVALRYVDTYVVVALCLLYSCYGVTLLPTGRIIVDYTLYSFVKENTRFFLLLFKKLYLIIEISI